MNRRSEYRDLGRARRTSAAQKVRYRARTGSGEGRSATREPWTEAEKAAVLERAVPDRELSRRLGRSVQAIQVRRCLLRSAA
jgi:hypothetical protein